MHCVLSAADAGNDNVDSNNIILTIKDTKLYAPFATLSAKEIQKLSKLLSTWFEDQCSGMNIKQKATIKIRQMSIDVFSNQTL